MSEYNALGGAQRSADNLDLSPSFSPSSPSLDASSVSDLSKKKTNIKIAGMILAGAGIIFVALLFITGVLSRPATNTYVVYNATIYTGLPEDSIKVYTAMAFDRSTGKILALGSDAHVLGQFGHFGSTQVNLQLATVIPGFIDAHVHLFELGRAAFEAKLDGSTSIQAVIDAIQPYYDAARKTPGQWVRGRGWDQTLLSPSQRFPTRFDLDTAFPDIPIMLDRTDSHALWINSAALRLLGNLPTQNPEGGLIVRDPQTGEPTGIFVDNAMDMVYAAAPAPTDEEMMVWLQKAIEICHSVGLTSVHIAGGDEQQVRVLKQAIDADQMDLRVYLMLLQGFVNRDDWCNKRELDYKGRLSIRSLKIVLDGALGSRGAALLEPYSDDPGNSGLILLDRASFYNETIEWIKCGFQVNTHAIGDKANRITVEVYGSVIDRLQMRYADLRLRVEHAQIIDEEDFPHFASYGLIASVQPTHATSDMHYAEARLGPDRIRTAYAWRTFLNNGIPLALGSDFPIELPDPLLGFYSAVTRQSLDGKPEGGWYPSQKLSRYEALVGFTYTPALAAFQEKSLGSLRPGWEADFVVLSDNIIKIPNGELPKVKVVQTWVAGQQVFQLP